MTTSSRALLSAVGALVLWGALAALSLRLRHVPPFFLLGVSLLTGGLLGLRRLSLRSLRARDLALGIYGLFAYHFCLFLALRTAPPVEANLLNYLWPLLIVLLSPLFVPGARLGPRHVTGALVAFGGAALLLAGPGLGGASLQTGHLLAVAAALIWSTFSLLSRRVGAAGSTAAYCLASGALGFLCHLLLEPRYVPTLAEVPDLLAIGLGPMGAAFYLWERGMREGDPRVIGTLAYLTPLLSTLLIAALGQGALSATSGLAAALIVGGAVLGTSPGRR